MTMNGHMDAVAKKNAERRTKRDELKKELKRVQFQLDVIAKYEYDLLNPVKGAAQSKRPSTDAYGKQRSTKKVGGFDDYSPTPRGPLSGAKRKSANALSESRDHKKQLEKERKRRQQMIWSQCATILKQLRNQKQCYPFIEPVDYVKLNIPDYPLIVKNPMCLNDIAGKLGGWDGGKSGESTRVYSNVMEFRDDVRLCWDNCRLYNPVGSDVRIWGDKMSDVFEKKWQMTNLEGKWLAEMNMSNDEDELMRNSKKLGSSYAGFGSPSYADGKSPTAMGSGSKPKKAKKDVAPVVPEDTDFKFKRDLSVQLGQLQAEYLGRVIDIINSGPSAMPNNGEEEIELDIDKLDGATLIALKKYVDSVQGKDAQGKAQMDKIQKMEAHQAATKKNLEEVDAQLASQGKASPGSSKPQDTMTQNKTNDSSDSESDSDIASDGENDMKKRSSPAGDVTRVSTTRPQTAQTEILKDAAPNREVNLKNKGAWESLTAPTGETPRGDDKALPTPRTDSLWTEFQSREQQIKAREKSKVDQAEQMRVEREREEEANRKRLESERVRKAEEARQRALALAREIDARREEDRAMTVVTTEERVGPAEQAAIMRQQQRAAGPRVLMKLGLCLKDSLKEDDNDSIELIEGDNEEGEL